MKCPNLNCIEGDIPEPTPDTEHLPLICPDCQKRFCPSGQCRHQELNEDNLCEECGSHYPEHAVEEDEGDSSEVDQQGSGSDNLEDFIRALRRD